MRAMANELNSKFVLEKLIRPRQRKYCLTRWSTHALCLDQSRMALLLPQRNSLHLVRGDTKLLHHYKKKFLLKKQFRIKYIKQSINANWTRTH